MIFRLCNFRYFCNGAKSQNEPHETWSSSKIFAMANAAGKLRGECSSAGVDGSVTGRPVYFTPPLLLLTHSSFCTGKHGITPLGDLASVVCSYDSTAGYSSNSLSSYFHDLGWRDRIHGLVTGDWLGRSSETLGGNYGEKSPSDLGFSVSCTDGSTCAAAKDPSSPYVNTLSVLRRC